MGGGGSRSLANDCLVTVLSIIDKTDLVTLLSIIDKSDEDVSSLSIIDKPLNPP